MIPPKDDSEWIEMANSFDEDGNLHPIVLSAEAWEKLCAMAFPDLTPEGVAELTEEL